MPNVTQSNFIEESNELIRLLPSASFVAIDEEMTGISMPNSPRMLKDQTPAERYEHLKAAPENYSIIQLGICLFHQHPDFEPGRGTPEFIARKYNFYLFPPSDNKITREVVLNPSSIGFLNQHNMDFNRWFRHGIPFVTGDMAEKLLSKFQKNESERREKAATKAPATPGRHGQRRVELRRTEDINFLARAMASLREWLDSAHPIHNNVGAEEVPEGLSFLLPPANSFLRRALYESVQAEYPALILENAGGSYPNQIRVMRLNPDEQRAREERLRRETWEKLIVHQIGVWRVFMALSLACHGLEIPTDSITFAKCNTDINWDKSSSSVDSLTSVGRKIPIILHNGYMDLMFLLTHFHSHTLPPTFSEAKSVIHGYFPTIYDTKYLSTECTPASLWNESTHLEGLFTKIIRENDDISRLVELVPDVAGSSGFAYLSEDEGQAHDAGFDSFMTGAVYVGVCHIIALNQQLLHGLSTLDAVGEGVGSLKHLLYDEDEKSTKSVFGRNQLYLMQSIYSVDLENAHDDPLCRGKIADSIFRISNFDPSVTTRTIIQCLSDLVDSNSDRVNFEIIWVDDTTFLVAASRKASSRESIELGDQDDSSSGEAVVLREHGQLILRALRERFPREDIVSWNDYITSGGVEVVAEFKSWTTRFGQLIGSLLGLASTDGSPIGKKREMQAGTKEAQPERKRRRIY